MTQKICKKFIISGHVQGVWFRASTRDQANNLGLTGWVKNLNSGDVEVIACGTEQQLEILHQWLQHGPENARVDQVVVSDSDWCEFQQFNVK